jgi:YgjP-like, metallopeptidase domain
MTHARRHDEFKDRVRSWAQRVRVKPAQIRIQRMSRKWASCSPRGWCTFAADLIDEPTAFQDYVIVRELLHLKLRNHGCVFRSLLTAHVPTWRRWCPTGLGTSCAARSERYVPRRPVRRERGIEAQHAAAAPTRRAESRAARLVRDMSVRRQARALVFRARTACFRGRSTIPADVARVGALTSSAARRRAS